MHSIQWTDEFAIGIGEIDDQHRQLIEMINALETNKNSDETAANSLLLEQLNDYVRDHFALEERLMVKGRCAREFFDRHSGEHAYFRGALKDFTADFEGGRSDVNASLIEYLVHWLLHHIVVIDRDMAAQLHCAVPHLEAEVEALAKHFTADLTEAERHLITDLQHSNTELLRLLKQAGAKTDTPAVDTLQSRPGGASEAMLLLANGSPGWLDEPMLARLCDTLRANSPGLRAAVIAGDTLNPDALADSVGALVTEGTAGIVIVPIVLSDALSRQFAECRARHPQVKLTLAEPLAGTDVVMQALAQAALRAL